MIEAYSDFDWCGDKVDRKSTFGYLYWFLNASISWCSKNQSVVALSSCEVEYISSSKVACQILWLESLLEELKMEYKRQVQLFVDNKSTISSAKSLVSHGRSKHIETKFHFLRDQVSKGKLELIYCYTKLKIDDEGKSRIVILIVYTHYMIIVPFYIKLRYPNNY